MREEFIFVSRRAPLTPFDRLGLCCLPNNARYKTAQPLLSNKLLDLDRKHFSMVHLLIQELHDSLKFSWNYISYEKKPELSLLQIAIGLFPKCFRIDVVSKKLFQFARCIHSSALTVGSKSFSHVIDAPMLRCICGVVQHLSYNFPANARVATSFHLNNRRYGILIDEQMIY